MCYLIIDYLLLKHFLPIYIVIEPILHINYHSKYYILKHDILKGWIELFSSNNWLLHLMVCHLCFLSAILRSVTYDIWLSLTQPTQWNWKVHAGNILLGRIKASFSFHTLIPKTLKCLPYIVICHSTSLSPWLIIFDKNNFVKCWSSGGHWVCL